MDDYDETPVLIIFLGEYSRLFLVVWEMQHMCTVSGTSVCPVRNLHTYADLLRVMSSLWNNTRGTGTDSGFTPGVPGMFAHSNVMSRQSHTEHGN